MENSNDNFGTVVITSMDHEGKGIAHVNEKILFIDNAIIGEKVLYKTLKKKKNISFAKSIKVYKASSQRVTPQCRVYGVCGGCSMQHIEISSQLALKQRAFEETLWHVGQVKPIEILRPIAGPSMHYRHKARLRVKFIKKKQQVLIGFNEKMSHFLTNMSACPVLPLKISNLILPLQNLFGELSIKEKIPQIEYSSNQLRHILVLRILDVFSDEDCKKLKDFQNENDIEFWTQTKGYDTVAPMFDNLSTEITYTNIEFNIQYLFNPTGFTQINPFVNQVLIRKVFTLIKPNKNDHILDFFSGAGNFSLPLATSGAKVIAVEGDELLVQAGNLNVKRNKLDQSLLFKQINLFSLQRTELKDLGLANKWLIDPPRDGALNLINLIDDEIKPIMIVYISCNVATLARDAKILVNQKGYQFVKGGLLNMFPHTSHIESIAIFELSA